MPTWLVHPIGKCPITLISSIWLLTFNPLLSRVNKVSKRLLPTSLKLTLVPWLLCKRTLLLLALLATKRLLKFLPKLSWSLIFLKLHPVSLSLIKFKFSRLSRLNNSRLVRWPNSNSSSMDSCLTFLNLLESVVTCWLKVLLVLKTETQLFGLPTTKSQRNGRTLTTRVSDRNLWSLWPLLLSSTLLLLLLKSLPTLLDKYTLP